MQEKNKGGIDKINKESLYDAVFENSMDAILITAPDGRVFAANKAACDMFRMTENELCNAGRNGLVDLTDDRIPPMLEERKRNGKTFGEYRHKRKDGSLFPSEVSSRIFRDSKGRECTITVVRDITRRNTILEELHQSRDFAEELINTANVIFVQLDQSGRVTKINRITEEILGYKQEEINGKSWFDIAVPKERFPEVWEEFKNVTGYKKIAGTFENPVITRNGDKRQIIWSNSILLRDGKELGTISFGIDITERKLTEESLRASKEYIERLNDAI